MISIKFKIVSVLVALAGAYFLVGAASAQAFTYERTPSGTEITSPVSFYLNTTEAEWGNGLDSEVNTKVCIGLFDNTEDQNATWFDEYIYWDNGVLDGTIVLDLPVDNEYTIVAATAMQPAQNCSAAGVAPSFDFLETSAYPTALFTIIEGAPTSSNATWGDSGLWGEVTTDDVADTLTAGVQNTGANIWPLLIFAGIALAFIIFLQVVFLTQKSVKPTVTVKKKTFDPVAFDKKADELQEYFSKTGGADPVLVETIKRKRGRPRKQI